MRKRWIIFPLLAAVSLALLVFAVSRAGTWLVVEDPLEHASCAIVFGGRPPFRAMEAAKLYRDGWVPEIDLTKGTASFDDTTLERLGIRLTPEYEINRQVLERLGVPKNAIRVIEGKNNNTAEEVRTLTRALRESEDKRVILVTSNFHTRRVKTLWRAAGNRPQAIVRYTSEGAFDVNHWWRDAADATAVLHEWCGLLNAWIGFPITSKHW